MEQQQDQQQQQQQQSGLTSPHNAEQEDVKDVHERVAAAEAAAAAAPGDATTATSTDASAIQGDQSAEGEEDQKMMVDGILTKVNARMSIIINIIIIIEIV